MNSALLLPMILFSSFFTGLIIFFLGESMHKARTFLNLLGAVLKVVLVVQLLAGVHAEEPYHSVLKLAPGVEIVLTADALSVFFVTLSAALWLLTTIYAIGYLERSPNRSRFFGFFSICVSATTGVALSGNLITFLLFYELLTLSTYPLVIHKGGDKALRAGQRYLAYTLIGGAILLFAIAWLQSLAGPVAFVPGGALAPFADEHAWELKVIFALLILGLGVKAAIVPLHGWLPNAMVAPAPVSSLLHAVAVVKAGAFGIVRMVYEVYGIELSRDLGLLHPLAIVASITILYGSFCALAQDELKKRLAYSTVSQVSYIVLGAAIFGPVATIGGIVHLFHQGIMKITLFFAAGNYAQALGIHRISQMNGVGRKMPWTTVAFSVGALGMIGVPPLAGYVSKWYLQKGGVEGGEPWISAVLSMSSLLNAAYFLPILYRAWFLSGSPEQEAASPAKRTDWWMLVLPPVLTALFVVYAGAFAETPYSPLEWAKMIAQREYEP